MAERNWIEQSPFPVGRFSRPFNAQRPYTPKFFLALASNHSIDTDARFCKRLVNNARLTLWLVTAVSFYSHIWSRILEFREALDLDERAVLKPSCINWMRGLESHQEHRAYETGGALASPQ